MAEEREVKQWITVNGKHVPIYEDTDYEPNKEKQIEKNKQQAETKNSSAKEKEDAWNKKVDEYIKKMVDNTQIEEGKHTKNSDRIFNAMFHHVVKDIQKGREYDQLASLTGYDKENEYVNSRQTLRGIQASINKQIQDSKTDFRLGITDNKEFNQEIKALQIIQRTLNATKKEKNW